MLILSLSLALAMGKAPAEKEAVALDFTLKDLKAQPVSLSQYKGKVVFLNFWATWCPPCRSEMPSMQTLQKKLGTDKFVMIAVAIDREGESRVRPFVEKGGYTFKVLLDPAGKVASDYSVRGIPTTFIIDKEGRVVERVVGARDWGSKEVVARLKKLL